MQNHVGVSNLNKYKDKIFTAKIHTTKPNTYRIEYNVWLKKAKKHFLSMPLSVSWFCKRSKESEQ